MEPEENQPIPEASAKADKKRYNELSPYFTRGYAYFAGDPSVGLNSYAYDFEIPKVHDEHREETRRMLMELYIWMDGESSCRVVFDDERDDDPEPAMGDLG